MKLRFILSLILAVVIIAVAMLPTVTPSHTAEAAPTIETFTSTPAGGNWTVPDRVTSVKVLVVGGGGGGAKGQAAIHHGNGGGGGTSRYNASYPVVAGTNVTVTVGTGGAGGSGTTPGSDGGSSVFGTITATGGKGALVTGKVGGANADYSGGTSTTDAAGGGGAGGGGNGGGGWGGGSNGGNGYDCDITGSTVGYAGGGGSAGNSGLGVVVDGGGLGSNGGWTNGLPGTTNTGGGGGGGGIYAVGGAGGSGVIIISYTILTVTTQAVTDITKTGCTGNGNITDIDAANATRRGFCYKAGTSGDPTTADSVAYDDGDFSTGAYTKAIAGLTAGTGYRVRAYAVDSQGTSYGNTVQMYTVADWGLTDYAYRKTITIPHTDVGAQTNYQIRFNIVKGNSSNSGCTAYLNGSALDWPDDVRFTKADGTTLLDFWIEEYDATDGTWWVEFDAIPAHPDDGLFYMYWGKASDTSASNGDNTFPYFDDASTNKSANYTPVDIYALGFTSAIAYDAINKQYNLSHTTHDNELYKINTGVFGEGYAYTLKGNITTLASNNNSAFGWYIRHNGSARTSDRGYSCRANRNSNVLGVEKVNNTIETSLASTGVTINASTWYEMVVYLYATNNIKAELYNASGTLLATATATDATYTGDSYKTAGLLFTYRLDTKVSVKGIYIRKYVSPEPTCGTWGEWEPVVYLTTSSGSGGNVSTPGEGTYPYYYKNQIVNISTTADSCYHFVNWTGDTTTIVDVNASSTTITMSANCSISANFAIAVSSTLTYTAGANGSINGTSPQTVNCGANGSAVTAVPDSFYSFANWSDASTANPRTDTNVVSNISVTANFVINAPTIGTVALWTTGGSPVETTSLTPQVEFNIKIPVTDNDTLNDLVTVNATLYYDSDGTYSEGEVPTSGNTQTCAILTWTKSTNTLTIDSGSGSSWAVNNSSSIFPSLSGTSGTFEFHFKPGKVATQTTGSAEWHIYVKATDSITNTGTGNKQNLTMNWYSEIVVNTGTVDWGNVTAGLEFAEGDPSEEAGISVTYICNGAYNQQAKASTPWTGSPSGTATLNTGGTPGANEFSLKANDDGSLTSTPTQEVFTSNTSWTVPDRVTSVKVLVVGGGGGGANGIAAVHFGNAGGGGTCEYNTSYPVTAGTNVSVAVGGGGAGAADTATGGTGGNSSFGTILATGGIGATSAGTTGGANADYAGGTSTLYAGGGGGAGGGGNGGGGYGGGSNGGNGFDCDITGSIVGYAGGGSSAASTGVGVCVDGGGQGTNGWYTNGGPGTANTGGGGGGDGIWATGGNGGSGVVIISYTILTVSDSYQTFDTGTQTSESGNTEASNSLWLRLGTPFTTATYSGTIYYQIAQ